MEKQNFVFIDMREFEGGQAFRGAALVTDGTTEPLEFRCTSLIQPTDLQRTLWGQRLVGHIASQLIGKPLIDALKNPFALVLVRRPEFMELRPLIESLPLVQLLRNEELERASVLSASASDGEGLIQDSARRFEPIVIKVHKKYADDEPMARDLLNEPIQGYSFIEPFERISSALEVLGVQEAKS